MTTVVGAGSWIARVVHSKTWSSLLNGNDGSVLNAPQLNDKTVTVNGTFGAGGSITIEGNNDNGSTWDTMHDVNGNVLTFTANGTKAIAENAAYIRPHVTAGDGTTSLSVVIVSTKSAG